MKRLLLASLLLTACDVEENIALTSNAPHDPSSVGGTRWSVRLGGAGLDRPTAVGVDSLGDVVAVGETTSNPVDFGSGPTTVPRATAFHSFVTKRVASDGAERWTQMLVPTTAGSMAQARDLALAPDDDVVVVGIYAGTVDFGGQTLTTGEHPYHGDVGFLARYAPNGELRWVHDIEVSPYVLPWQVVVDSNGQTYVSGVTAARVDQGGYDEGVGNWETFLWAFDAAGTKTWDKSFTSTAGTFPTDLAIADNGDVLLAGEQHNSAEFGGATLDAGDYGAIFLARYRFDGLYLSSRTFGTAMFGDSTSDARVEIQGTRMILQYFHRVQGTWGATHLEAIDGAGNSVWTTSIPNHDNLSPMSRNISVLSSGQVVTSAFNNAAADWTQPATIHGEMEVVTLDDAGTDGRANMWSTAIGEARFVDSAVGPDDAISFAGTFSGTGDFGGAPLQTTGFGDNDIVLVAAEPAN